MFKCYSLFFFILRSLWDSVFLPEWGVGGVGGGGGVWVGGWVGAWVCGCVGGWVRRCVGA